MRRTRILTHPGVHEDRGLYVIEVNISGIPCVIYNVPGLWDSVRDGKTNLQAKNGNIEDLIGRIVNVLDGHRLGKKLSRKALKYAGQLASWMWSLAICTKILKRYQ